MKINEQALAALLESRDGPVGQVVERHAQEIAAAAQRNAAVIMHRYPEVVSAIDYEMTSGTEAVVGIRDEGSISRYLAEKTPVRRAGLAPAGARRGLPWVGRAGTSRSEHEG